jgi:hypothetical protein
LAKSIRLCSYHRVVAWVPKDAAALPDRRETACHWHKTYPAWSAESCAAISGRIVSFRSLTAVRDARDGLPAPAQRYSLRTFNGSLLRRWWDRKRMPRTLAMVGAGIGEAPSLATLGVYPLPKRSAGDDALAAHEGYETTHFPAHVASSRTAGRTIKHLLGAGVYWAAQPKVENR